MTTIAYRDRTLASDSISTLGAIATCHFRKIARAPDGTLVAAAGGTLACGALLRWVDGGMAGPLGLSNDDFTALAVNQDGELHFLSGDGSLTRIEADFFAIGSGSELALGAMAAGVSARRAVEIACQFDGHSGGEIRVVAL
ncbi:MAG: hypothetical protein NVSMB20_05320 [Bradyrhizobium sp.]